MMYTLYDNLLCEHNSEFYHKIYSNIQNLIYIVKDMINNNYNVEKNKKDLRMLYYWRDYYLQCYRICRYYERNDRKLNV